MSPTQRNALLEQYWQSLLEEDDAGIEQVLAKAPSDPDFVSALTDLHRRYEDEQNLAPTPEARQEGLELLQKLLGAQASDDTVTESSLETPTPASLRLVSSPSVNDERRTLEAEYKLVSKQILEVLHGTGYRVQAETLRIAGQAFEFDAILCGPDEHQGLVLLIKERTSSLDVIKRRLHSFAHALKQIDSRPPITLILIAGLEDSGAIDELRSFHPYGRVILVRPGDNPSKNKIRRALSELMRLNVPTPVNQGSAAKLLHKKLGDLRKDKDVQRILRAGNVGPVEVEAAIVEMLQEAVHEAEEVI